MKKYIISASVVLTLATAFWLTDLAENKSTLQQGEFFLANVEALSSMETVDDTDYCEQWIQSWGGVNDKLTKYCGDCKLIRCYISFLPNVCH